MPEPPPPPPPPLPPCSARTLRSAHCRAVRHAMLGENISVGDPTMWKTCSDAAVVSTNHELVRSLKIKNCLERIMTLCIAHHPAASNPQLPLQGSCCCHATMNSCQPLTGWETTGCAMTIYSP